MKSEIQALSDQISLQTDQIRLQSAQMVTMQAQFDRLERLFIVALPPSRLPAGYHVAEIGAPAGSDLLEKRMQSIALQFETLSTMDYRQRRMAAFAACLVPEPTSEARVLAVVPKSVLFNRCHLRKPFAIHPGEISVRANFENALAAMGSLKSTTLGELDLRQDSKTAVVATVAEFNRLNIKGKTSLPSTWEDETPEKPWFEEEEVEEEEVEEEYEPARKLLFRKPLPEIGSAEWLLTQDIASDDDDPEVPADYVPPEEEERIDWSAFVEEEEIVEPAPRKSLIRIRSSFPQD